MIDLIEERLYDEFIKKEIEICLNEFMSKCIKLGKRYNHKIEVSVNATNTNTGSQINIIRG